MITETKPPSTLPATSVPPFRQPLKALSWMTRSIKKRGVVQTSKIAFSTLIDLGFDLRYGTDTRSKVELDQLDIHSENVANGVFYQPSKTAPLLKLINKLDIPKDGGFVDFGSGKGRVLLVAAKTGFKNVVGVEFSDELCSIAKKNIVTFAEKTGIKSRIEVVASDVTQFPVEPEQNVFFMYNPFNGVVMRQVLGNIKQSVQQFPRKVWLIYNTPEHVDVIANTKLFSTHHRYEIGGTDFVVFQSQA